MSTYNLCFEKKNGNYIRIFVSENFPFLVVRFLIYLNRRVFEMSSEISTKHGNNRN